MFRKVDNRNRISIPSAMLEMLGGCKTFDVTFVGNNIVLTPLHVKCSLCGKEVHEIKYIPICKECGNK